MKHAVAWAKERGLKRTSEVHGKEEFRVPVDFSFENKGIDRTRLKAAGEFEVQAGRSMLVRAMLGVPAVPFARVVVACSWEMVPTSVQTGL